MAVRIAINGFGRIGRCVLRAWIETGRDDIEIVAINDLGPIETNAHLLKYDSVHGFFNADISVEKDHLIVDGHRIQVTAERNPADLPWSDIDIWHVGCRKFCAWRIVHDRGVLCSHCTTSAIA